MMPEDPRGWRITQPEHMPPELLRDVIREGHLHLTTFGGVHILLHYDPETEHVDVYKLLAHRRLTEEDLQDHIPEGVLGTEVAGFIEDLTDLFGSGVAHSFQKGIASEGELSLEEFGIASLTWMRTRLGYWKRMRNRLLLLLQELMENEDIDLPPESPLWDVAYLAERDRRWSGDTKLSEDLHRINQSAQLIRERVNSLKQDLKHLENKLKARAPRAGTAVGPFSLEDLLGEDRDED